MKPIEDIVVDKIYQLVNQVLSKIIKPDIKVENITQIDVEMIAKIKQDYGIEGIILDVDETLRKDMLPLPETSKRWIESIKNELKIIVVSNGIDEKVQEYLQGQDIEYIGAAFKPLKSSFNKACKKLNIDSSKVLVIGDSIIDDILGGKRSNMKTALVKNVPDDSER